MKNSLSSLELMAIVNELQFLVRAKISQIYHQERGLILQLHVAREGKQFVKILPGKIMCLIQSKDAPGHPSGFCLQLRKYLDGAIVQAISQKDSERVVVFELDGHKEKYFLVIELFSKGNIILTDKSLVVITALEAQQWKDRTIKPREQYKFPTSGVNYQTVTSEKLKEILHKSEKRNLVISLATDLGLGGLYAEEICKLTGINKNKFPKEVEERETTYISKIITEWLKQVKAPKGYIYAEEITPFPLIGREPLEIFSTYNQAIDTLKLFIKASPYDQKIKARERIIFEQEESIKQLEENIQLNKRKGELIYEHYSKLHQLLEIVKGLKRTKDWKEVGEELKKVKKITSVDLKNKKVTVDL
ncbi:NFACT family protein [Candidatus Woesearchaeota archaeon]|nr:NFACT family protein [Candidatus Woesearchaeota archaeon]